MNKCFLNSDFWTEIDFLKDKIDKLAFEETVGNIFEMADEVFNTFTIVIRMPYLI